eukprot:8268405-Karenia_brevis.AAC.1
MKGSEEFSIQTSTMKQPRKDMVTLVPEYAEVVEIRADKVMQNGCLSPAMLEAEGLHKECKLLGVGLKSGGAMGGPKFATLGKPWSEAGFLKQAMSC